MTYALELKDLRKSFGKTEIIRGVNLAVNAGERVGIIGPNGAGKSTLFNLISGRFEPSSGDVLLGGQRINGKKPFEINRLGLSRSFQITNIFPKLSVFENLRCGVLWSLGYKYTSAKILIRSISSASTTPSAQWQLALIAGSRMARRFAESFLESSIPAGTSPPSTTAAATTGPASGPRPASSTPMISGRVKALAF